MPIFADRLDTMAATNRLAGRIYLHTEAPTNGDETNGRVTVGGGMFENGYEVDDTDWSAASGGDIKITVALDFGEADEDIGSITHWSFIADGSPDIPIAYDTLPNRNVQERDTYQISADTIGLLGSS